MVDTLTEETVENIEDNNNESIENNNNDNLINNITGLINPNNNNDHSNNDIIGFIKPNKTLIEIKDDITSIIGNFLSNNSTKVFNIVINNLDNYYVEVTNIKIITHTYETTIYDTSNPPQNHQMNLIYHFQNAKKN